MDGRGYDRRYPGGGRGDYRGRDDGRRDGRSMYDDYDPHYNRDGRYDRYGRYERSRSPPRTMGHHRVESWYDRYGSQRDGRDNQIYGSRRERSTDRYDSRDERRYDRSYNGRDAGYTFRGASERDSYHGGRAEEDFTFRAPQGPEAPRFPPQEHPRGNQNTRHGPGRQNFAGRGRGRGGRGRRPPEHARDILHHQYRGGTPERLEGMNAQAHFTAVDSGSDDESNSKNSNDGGNGDQSGARKRQKTENVEAVERPKWSNPEIFTALPPPENTGGPKKDIVKVIRKAKVEPAAQPSSANAVKDNADFISFNFDDDMSEGEVNSSDSVSPRPPSNAPSGPASLRHHELTNGNHMSHTDKSLGFEPRSSTLTSPPSSRAKRQRERSSSASSSVMSLATDHAGPPPAPPPGFVMPTDNELAAQFDAGKGKGKKRKHAEQSQDVSSVVPGWRPNGATNPTPWFRADRANAASSAMRSVAPPVTTLQQLNKERLHMEICDFYEFVRPQSYEESVRRDLIQRTQLAVRATHDVSGANSTTVKSFGSFASGLYLPTADMDLVVLSVPFLRSGSKAFGQTVRSVRKIGYSLARQIAVPGTMVPITHARVPIVKFTDSITGIKVDVSFDNDSGTKAIENVRQWATQYPSMPVLVALIKQMLAMRNLNEVFNGGLGGFAIICLVVSMLQLMPQAQADSIDPTSHHAELLMEFLDLYGNKFDIRRTGITMNPPGYFNKEESNKMYSSENQRLTIIDPNKSDNDITGGTRNIDKIFGCFRDAHQKLRRHLFDVSYGRKLNDSVLGCIWGGNYSSFISQRNKLSMIYRGQPINQPPPQGQSETKSADRPTGQEKKARKQQTNQQQQQQQKQKQKKKQKQKQPPPPQQQQNHKKSAAPQQMQHPLPQRPDKASDKSGQSQPAKNKKRNRRK